MRTEVKNIVEEARQTGVINFGGEYSFLTTDTHAEALAKLYHTGCQIGGMASAPNTFSVKVIECYAPGYWLFYWHDANKGVARIQRWLAVESVDLEEPVVSA